MDKEYGRTEDGLLLPAAARVLDSPEQFDRGPRGTYNEATSREFAAKMVRPTWYVLADDAGGTVQGPTATGERLTVVQVGSNPDARTHLYLYGRLREGESSHSAFDRPHIGAPGEVVWGYISTSSDGKEWHIDMYNDGSGYAWSIQEDPQHADVGRQQRHLTTMHALAAAVRHLQEDGVPGLIPIIPTD